MIFFEEELNLLDAFIGEGQDPVVIVGAVHPDDAPRARDRGARTWASQTCGSISFILALTIRL
jgi:hypothetical protein